MLLNVTDIQKILPHRYPFLLVDRITELNIGDSVVGYKNVSISEPVFQGHFPDHPNLPRCDDHRGYGTSRRYLGI